MAWMILITHCCNEYSVVLSLMIHKKILYCIFQPVISICIFWKHSNDGKILSQPMEYKYTVRLMLQWLCVLKDVPTFIKSKRLSFSDWRRENGTNDGSSSTWICSDHR